ncbi:hypothetical protein E2C01_025937 [Portunus trituberculatus]|uniref:Uncharacterized protein n=1 Tax=Portunus trituberculatus TaxID=210409 RepID=A0A5B7EHI2_PORTR|nr:hypothetical protein [Portunus trituberculatus]
METCHGTEEVKLKNSQHHDIQETAFITSHPRCFVQCSQKVQVPSLRQALFTGVTFRSAVAACEKWLMLKIFISVGH